MTLSQPNKRRKEINDRVKWTCSQDGEFSVKSRIQKINELMTPILSKPLVDLILQKVALTRAQLTPWMAILGKLKTGSLLLAFGVVDLEEATYSFCEADMETYEYLQLPFIIEHMDELHGMVVH